ncbi:MAG TPA: hypothetical protein VHC69_34810 [Polyangiaceae bacterium]|nr:hypothetical protein [Polyangiaceae bacterium]
MLDDVTSELMAPVRALGHAAIELIVSNREEFRASLMDDLRRQEHRLQAVLPDTDSRDTLGWVLAFLRSLFGVALAVVQPSELAALDTQVAAAAEDEDFRALMKTQVALMAAVEAAKSGENNERCTELVDVAFLNAMKFKKAIRRQGLWLAPFPNETSDEQRDSLKRYASSLRETLTVEDWKTLDGARMGNLR